MSSRLSILLTILIHECSHADHHIHVSIQNMLQRDISTYMYMCKQTIQVGHVTSLHLSVMPERSYLVLDYHTHLTISNLTLSNGTSFFRSKSIKIGIKSAHSFHKETGLNSFIRSISSEILTLFPSFLSSFRAVPPKLVHRCGRLLRLRLSLFGAMGTYDVTI